MENILLIVSTTRMSHMSVEHALRCCRTENKSLKAVFILDNDLPDFIFDKLTMEGYIGDKPGKIIHDAVMQTYEIRGRAVIEDICRESTESGVKCDTIFLEGNFLESCRNIISGQKIDRVVITRRKRSILSKFIFGSAIDQLMKEFKNVIFEVFEEED